MKLLLVHPGASWSTADVEAGLRFGLEHHGVEIVRYRLDARIGYFSRYLSNAYKRAKRAKPDIEKPTYADVLYQAGVGALEMALRHRVDAVLVVSAMYLHPDVVIMMKRAGLKVFVLFTESPYDTEHEMKIAATVDGCWVSERIAVPWFRNINPHSGYLPHGWHPERHTPDAPVDDRVRAHDVVFVGSGFRERIEWLSAIDWTGIDLGLYGSWEMLGSRHRLRKSVCGSITDNVTTAALYRRAKVGLNLYRQSKGFGRDAPRIDYAESLNPRAYELAACGVFFVSDYRAEHRDMFGDLAPTFRTPTEAGALIRAWLADEAGRARVAQQLPACVAEASWVERATRVIGDLQSLRVAAVRGDTHGTVPREKGRDLSLDEWQRHGDHDGQPVGMDAQQSH